MSRIFAFALGALAVVVAVTFAGSALKAANTGALWWLYDVVRLQDRLAERPASGGRLVFAGGSATLFGIDGAYAERATGRTVVNLGLHAGFSIDMFAQRVRRHVRAGDTVVAALEYEVYFRNEKTTLEQREGLLWMQGLHGGQTLWENLRDNWATPMERYGNLLRARLLRGARGGPSGQPEMRFLPDAAVGARAMALTGAGARPEEDGFPYRIEAVDRWGALYAAGAPRDSALEAMRDPAAFFLPPQWTRARPFSLAQLRALKAMVEARGAALVVTWPPMMDRDGANAADPVLAARLQALRADVMAEGIRFICRPESAFIPAGYFLDTGYHLNSWGATARTMALARCLAEEKLVESAEALAAPAGFPAAETIAAQMRRRNAAPYAFETRRDDLNVLREALAAYRQANGAYPVSEGWASRVSAGSADGWITGLVPNFLPALPRDPRRDDVAEHQYLYRSDGQDYKIIAQDKEQCLAVRDIHPELRDSARDCSAYGHASSARAARW